MFIPKSASPSKQMARSSNTIYSLFLPDVEKNLFIDYNLVSQCWLKSSGQRGYSAFEVEAKLDQKQKKNTKHRFQMG